MSIRPLHIFAAALLVVASSQAASLSQFKGTYKGNFSALGSIGGNSQSANGTATVKITPSQKNQAATIKVSGTDPETGRDYNATIKLKKDGTVTTDSIVPGIDYEATGTWKLSSNGKKITVKLSAESSVATATGVATLQVSGDVLKVKSSGNVSSFVGSGSGKFNFTGTK